MTDAHTAIKAADLQKIGVSKPYAYQLIAGSRSPSLRLALQIEAALGVPPTAWPLKAADLNNPCVHGGPAPVDDAATMAPGAAHGAGANQEIVQ